MTELVDVCDDDVLCRVCGEFYVDGHMPACPNTAAGQPHTWLGAAVEVLRQSAAPLSIDEILYNIREQGLRHIHVRATPKSSLRSALAEACRTPEIPVRRDPQGNFVYDAAF